MFNKKRVKKTGAGSREKSNGKLLVQTDEILQEDRVRLPPVLGVRPGIYLAALYSFIILAVLFFVLIYPGLSKPGSVAVFRSEPAGAAVRVDGIYRGTTPCEFFIAKGERIVEFVLPGFNSVSVETNIPGRIFASFFVPRQVSIAETLEAGYPLEPLVLGAVDFAAWSLAGEPTAAYQIPLSLSEGAYQAGPAAADPLAREAMDGVLDAALRFAVTRAGLRDMLRAKFLVDNGGLSPSPATALSSVRDILGRLAETPEAAVALAGYLPPEAAAAVKGSAWYAEAVSGMAPDALDTAAADDQRGSASPRRLELGGITFIETAGGNFVTGGVVPRRVSTGDFWIAAAAVSPSSWEAFLAANPRWNVQNAVLLKEQGLVTEDYLVSFTGGPPDTGVSSVSWYAAQAFCEWFTSLLPPAFSSYEVRLPTELEWEYVASISSIRDTMGSLWEWCKDPYVPLDFFPATEEAAALIGSPERSLRGGSWINQPDSVNTATRASLPPQICSPFVSFRPIIVLKEGAGSE